MPKLNLNVSVLSVEAFETGRATEKLNGPITVNQSTPNPTDDLIVSESLKDESSMTTSQFMEQAKYMNALEQELALSVGAISSVESARVHLALPNTKPLNMLDGKYILSDSLTSSFVNEVVPFKNKETLDIFSSYNSL